ncbi:MAG: hypothetical protein ACJATI_004822 [Halioglobus sp.]
MAAITLGIKGEDIQQLPIKTQIMLTNILLIIILLHLVVGFGWLVYKLSPRKGDELIDSSEDLEN